MGMSHKSAVTKWQCSVECNEIYYNYKSKGLFDDGLKELSEVSGKTDVQKRVVDFLSLKIEMKNTWKEF